MSLIGRIICLIILVIVWLIGGYASTKVWIERSEQKQIDRHSEPIRES